jgi:ABC-type multidrug transport system ATPase subunit/pSer/pThr/pTyr-binding forkhead associated (FHA) protein
MMEDGMSDSAKGTLFLKPAQISITWPDGKNETVPLLKDSLRVGRGGENNNIAAPLEFKSISRRHFEIRREGGNYHLVDLRSTNGVYVNGQKTASILLKDHDEIRIGLAEDHEEILIRFQAGMDALAAADLSEEQSPPNHPLSNAGTANQPHLIVRFPNGQTGSFSIQSDVLVLGRAPEADLTIPYRFISARHFEIRRTAAQFTITDLGSTNGTLVNNKRLIPDQQTPIHDNSIIRIGDDAFGTSLGITFVNPLEQLAPQEGFHLSAPTQMIDLARPLIIGRDPQADIRLDSPDVSRKHVYIRMTEGRYILEDAGSTNGTYVNNQRAGIVALKDGDLIEIGNFLLVFANGKVTPYQSNGMRLDVSGLSRDVRTRRGKLRILDQVNLSILPREFVAVVGGSGAGKSTLLNALVGIRRGSGRVDINGQDFYREYEHFRSQLGYVPQNDILHTSLTVDKALEYAARLRLPSHVHAAERRQRISAVLDTVSMNTETIRKTRIGELSGGQRKRVSIAAELLADPKLIYLDEATSGLDPGLEKKMMHTLRRMADEGRTVVLITHATDNIIQADHVAFLSQGRLIFFGPSQEALDFFEVDDFSDIYEKIENKGEQWREVFQEKKPANYQKYIQERQSTSKSMPKREISRPRFGPLDLLRQFIVLTQRSLSVLFSDPITLFLMLLLLPLTGTLQLIIGSKEILTGNLAILADPVAAAKTMVENYVPYARTNTFVFVMGLEAVLTGLFVPSNDLVKERSIYLRERMVNLKVAPYLMSKAFLYSIFVIIQVVLYLLILSFGVDFPANGLYLPGILELFVTLFLTMMAGITFGLIISAVSRSTEMAIYMLTMMLFFQFFFAGTVFDLRGNAFEPLSYFSTTRWSLAALGVTIDMPKIVESTILCSDVPTNPLDPNSPLKTVCQHYPDAVDDMLITYDKELLLKSWTVLIGMSLLFLLITGILLQRTKSD